MGNRKTDDQIVSEKFESYIRLPLSRISSAISKEQLLINSLEKLIKKKDLFDKEEEKLRKPIVAIREQKEKIGHSLFIKRMHLEYYEDYQKASSSFLGRLTTSKPRESVEYYENLPKEISEFESGLQDLALKLKYLESKLDKKRMEWNILKQNSRIQGDINRNKKNADLRLSALLKAQNLVQKKEESILEREQAASKEVSKHKAYAAAYFNESRKLAEYVKAELFDQAEIIKGCPYCGLDLDEIPHADHIYPISKGGLSVKENMIYVCIQCNLRKGGMTLREFILKTSMNRVFIEENLDKLGKKF